jgi:hypothetical protein
MLKPMSLSPSVQTAHATFFQEATTIDIGVRPDQQLYLQRTFWRIYGSNNKVHQQDLQVFHVFTA